MKYESSLVRRLYGGEQWIQFVLLLDPVRSANFVRLVTPNLNFDRFEIHMHDFDRTRPNVSVHFVDANISARAFLNRKRTRAREEELQINAALIFAKQTFTIKSITARLPLPAALEFRGTHFVLRVAAASRHPYRQDSHPRHVRAPFSQFLDAARRHRIK